MTIGKKLEEGIETLMSLSEDIIRLQEERDNAQMELAMFSTLYKINQYISNNLEISQLIPLVEDVVIGVVGANYCAVVTEDIPFKYSAGYNLELEYENLVNTIEDTIQIFDLSKEPMLGLHKGCICLHKMYLTDNSYAFLVVYWALECTSEDKKLQFVSILSTQTGLSLRNAKLMNILKDLAMQDPLTGLHNRVMLNSIETTSKPEPGECVIMFDIDNFKNINDTHGHAFGDVVLKDFANIIKKCEKETNASCFRYGGEEFLINYNGDEHEGKELADFIRKEFNQKTGYTVSAGVSGYGESCKISDYKTIIELADMAMYVSKQTGKDKTTISNSDLQLFHAAEDDLYQLLNACFINGGKDMPSLIRVDITSTCTLNNKEYKEMTFLFNHRLGKKDRFFITDSLTIFIIYESNVIFEEVEKDIKDLMNKNYPHLEYKIHECNRVFHEVAWHSDKMAKLVYKLGEKMGLDNDVIDSLSTACVWHDIGKLCIDPAVYLKPGLLTKEEFEKIKHHTWLGYRIAMKNPSLKDSAEWILMHHEDVDGLGYHGYQGDNIPLPAQVLAIIDRFDALTEDRCYRKAFTKEEAFKILKGEAQKFDTKLIETFMAIISDEFKEAETK